MAQEGGPEKKRMLERVAALRHVARGRIHRFRSRIVNMRQRRKETPLSASDAIN